MKIETAKALTVPFDRSKLKRTQGMDYIPIAEVVARMNEVMGVGKWRVEILKTEGWGMRQTQQLGECPSHIVATVRVHLLDDETGEWTWGEGMGGQDVNFFKVPDNAADNVFTKGPTNLGDAYKGACSDATKKALQQFGVGLELARDGQALDITEPTVDLVPYITRQVDGEDFLNEKQRAALKKAWPLKYHEFYYTNVPERMERELKEFIDSFRVVDTSESVEQPTLEPLTEQMWGGDLLASDVLITLEKWCDREGIDQTEATEIFRDSGYAENKSIGEEEWCVLKLMMEARIKQLQETSRPPLGAPA